LSFDYVNFWHYPFLGISEFLTFEFRFKNNEKTRQNAENKRTFDLTGKIETRKNRQNAENRQTFDLTGKIELDGKTRQNAENKQTLDLRLD